MHDTAVVLITIGGLMMAGLLTDLLGRYTALPRVTLLILFGFSIGPSGLDLLPTLSPELIKFLSNTALVMIGFLIGGSITVTSLQVYGRKVMTISIFMVLATLVIVTFGLYLTGLPLALALLLAGIAAATDPAATADVINESRAKGPFTQTLLGIVAIDDAWGLIAFTLVLTVANLLYGNGDVTSILLRGGWDIGGAFLLGVGLGVPMSYLSGRLADGKPLQVEAIGMVFLCGGSALWLEVSFIFAAMVMGSVVANLATHHKRAFHEIEGIEWPFLLLFFVLSGASLNLDSLGLAGVTLIAYLILRTAGRLTGSWLGGAFTHDPWRDRVWLGLATLPQAGVALGMGLVAAQQFPELAELLTTVVVAASIAFEVIGPIFTRLAIQRMGEVDAEDDQNESENYG